MVKNNQIRQKITNMENKRESLIEKVIKEINIHPVIINIVFEDTVLLNKMATRSSQI